MNCRTYHQCIKIYATASLSLFCVVCEGGDDLHSPAAIFLIPTLATSVVYLLVQSAFTSYFSAFRPSLLCVGVRGRRPAGAIQTPFHLVRDSQALALAEYLESFEVTGATGCDLTRYILRQITKGTSTWLASRLGEPRNQLISLDKSAPQIMPASLTIAAALIVLLLTSTGLTLCEAASRPMMLGILQKAADAEKSAQAHSSIPATDLATTADDVLSGPRPATSQTTTALQPGMAGDCHTSDITIEQDEVSGVGLPTFQVQITNSCTNPRCSISNVIVHCGLFHSGEVLVNPKVFRRLDAGQGSCIVNDGQPIRNADTVIFRYNEIWKQPIWFLSARIFCHA